MNLNLKNYIEENLCEFDSISSERKKILERIGDYVREKIKTNDEVNLLYVCTHNSRRSHFGQVWAKVAAEYYKIPNVHTFSGGTEATAFNINAINALKRVGFGIEQIDDSKNPRYQVFYDKEVKPIECFSKVYDSEENPKQNFAAIMTCSDAEENCPYIPGAELRIATTYNDPKEYDNTPLQDEKYDERCRQIAQECFYLFSKI